MRVCVCPIAKRSVWHWLASGSDCKKKQREDSPLLVLSWAESSRDTAPQISPSSACGRIVSHPSRSTSWSGGHSTRNTWEDKDRHQARSRVSRGDKTNTFIVLLLFLMTKTPPPKKHWRLSCWQTHIKAHCCIHTHTTGRRHHRNISTYFKSTLLNSLNQHSYQILAMVLVHP